MPTKLVLGACCEAAKQFDHLTFVAVFQTSLPAPETVQMTSLTNTMPRHLDHILKKTSFQMVLPKGEHKNGYSC